jgi:hypothetical protein
MQLFLLLRLMHLVLLQIGGCQYMGLVSLMVILWLSGIFLDMSENTLFMITKIRLCPTQRVPRRNHWCLTI